MDLFWHEKHCSANRPKKPVIVKNNSQTLLSADCWPTVGWQTANSLCYVWGQSVGRLSVNSRLTVAEPVGNLSVQNVDPPIRTPIWTPSGPPSGPLLEPLLDPLVFSFCLFFCFFQLFWKTLTLLNQWSADKMWRLKFFLLENIGSWSKKNKVWT